MVYAEAEGEDQYDPVHRLLPDDIQHKGQGGPEPSAILPGSQGRDQKEVRKSDVCLVEFYD